MELNNRFIPLNRILGTIKGEKMVEVNDESLGVFFKDQERNIDTEIKMMFRLLSLFKKETLESKMGSLREKKDGE